MMLQAHLGDLFLLFYREVQRKRIEVFLHPLLTARGCDWNHILGDIPFQ